MPEYGHHSVPSSDRLTAASLTYAIGDIHGSLSKLRRLMERCADHAQGRPTTFVFLGDYIDRGPESAGVVRYVIELQSRLREQVIALKGNHEAVALGVVDGTMPADYWLNLGGAATLRSYGIDRAEALPAEHVDWLRSLRSSHGPPFFSRHPEHPAQPHDLLAATFLSDAPTSAPLTIPDTPRPPAARRPPTDSTSIPHPPPAPARRLSQAKPANPSNDKFRPSRNTQFSLIPQGLRPTHTPTLQTRATLNPPAR